MARRTTRRDFLRNTAAGVGVAAFGVPAFAQEGSPNGKLDVAAVGVWNQGRKNLFGVGATENVIAICDVDERHLEMAGEKFPKAKKYRDYRAMLDKEKPDAVLVCTPDHHHAPASLRAMRQGYHCYTEKPLSHTIEEAREMAKVAKEKKLATQMGNGGHSSDGIRRVVEILRAGIIGPVREIHAWSDRPGGWWPQGLDRPTDTPAAPQYLNWENWIGPAPMRPYHPVYHPCRWRGWWDFGTGALGDMACHCLDPATWALNLGHPAATWAEGEPRKPECGPVWQKVCWEFPARDDMPPVRLTWYDGEINKGGEKTRHQPPKEITEGEDISRCPGGSLFIGDKGKLLLYDNYGGRRRLLPRDKFEGVQLPPATLPRSPGHHLEWIQACKEGGTGMSNFEYAGLMTEMIVMGVIAYRVNKRVEWDGAAMKAKNCPEAEPMIRKEYRKGWEI